MYSGFVVTSLSDDVTEGSPEATQSPTVLYRSDEFAEGG